MNTAEMLGAGLAGATTVTLIHETGRRLSPVAPRMDVLGMRALAGILRQLGQDVPAEPQLHTLALAGDILSNSLYYGLVALGKPEGALMRGALLGLAAGIGAVVLPGPLGLGSEPSNRTTTTQLLTVAYYLAGGLAAGAAYECLAGNENPE